MWEVIYGFQFAVSAACTESKTYRYDFSLSLISEGSELLLLFQLQNRLGPEAMVGEERRGS